MINLRLHTIILEATRITDLYSGPNPCRLFADELTKSKRRVHICPLQLWLFFSPPPLASNFSLPFCTFSNQNQNRLQIFIFSKSILLLSSTWTLSLFCDWPTAASLYFIGYGAHVNAALCTCTPPLCVCLLPLESSVWPMSSLLLGILDAPCGCLLINHNPVIYYVCYMVSPKARQCHK